MNSRLITIIFIVFGVLGLFLGYKLLKTQSTEGNQFDKCITVTINIHEEYTNEEYCTNKEYLGELIDEYNDVFNSQFTGSKTDSFGRLLVEINGYKLTSNEFFFIFVDDVYGSYGIDQQPIEDGVTYELRPGKY